MRGFAALVGIGALALALGAGAGAAGANQARCEHAVQGTGPVDWKERSKRAGPVAVFRGALGQMERSRQGLLAKMPLLVSGREPVTVSVPPRLRGRVFLYYGEMRDRDGRPTTSFTNNAGHATTRFEPCPGRARTPFPGGIRVRGRQPVRLTIATEAGADFTLQLGKPHPRSSG